MRRFLLPVSFCLAACLLPAQDEAEFAKSMKAIGKSMNTLKGLETKTGPEAVESAQKIVDAFQATGKHWTKAGTADAVKWTQDSTTHAETLLAAAKAGEQDKAAEAYKALGGSCRSCHEAHREKAADGSYKMK